MYDINLMQFRLFFYNCGTLILVIYVNKVIVNIMFITKVIGKIVAYMKFDLLINYIIKLPINDKLFFLFFCDIILLLKYKYFEFGNFKIVYI